jgi:hypothetical protein
LDLLIGFLLGVCTTLLVLGWAAHYLMRRYIKNKLAIRQLIAEMYHKDLLPEICRIEGLISLTVKDFSDDSIEMMALKEARKHKDKVTSIIKKYEQFQ